MDDHKKKVGVSLGVTSVLGVFYGLDPVGFLSFFSEAFHHQMVQATIAFSIAAFIHRQGQKKDIHDIADAIDSLGSKLEIRLESVELTVKQIHTRVETLEKR